MRWTAIILAVLCGGAFAEDYPARPITLVVPYPAGGGLDAMARVVGEKLSATFRQPVVIENRSGGNGNVGTRGVASAAPDGYTLLLGYTGTLAINPNLSRSAGYTYKSFTPIGAIASVPVALMAHPSVAARSVSELIALAKARPEAFNLGTGAVGTVGYLCGELFKMATGLDLTIVPYKGTAPLLNDLVGGHVPIAFGVIPPAFGNIQAGTIRVLAVTSAARTRALPDAPTIAESGQPGFEAVLRYGLLAPAGTPPQVVERINQALQSALATPDLRARITSEGGDPIAGSPEDYAADLDREDAKWSALIRTLRLSVD